VHGRLLLAPALVVVLGLLLAGVALSKEVHVTTCGADRCRTVTNGITGIGTQPGSVSTPRTGRFYTIEIEGPYGWKVVYEAGRRVVRAADLRARLFMGLRWARLTQDVRPHYARAVRGLAPLRSAPPYRP
jgi:hypothetical protein